MEEPESKKYWNQESDEVAETVDRGNHAFSDNPPLKWHAAEYIHGSKGFWWYIVFSLVVIGLIALDLFILKSYSFSALVLVMAVSLIVYIKRPARDIEYTLSADKGLYIGDKLYQFQDFKSFGVIRDGEHFSVMLIPTARFSQGISVYFPENLGEEIVDILGNELPMQELKLDLLDKAIRMLRL